MKIPRLLPALLLVALALRLGFLWYFYHHPRNILDVDAHVILGAALYERGEFAQTPGVPSLIEPVGFPAWIALIFTVFGKRIFAVFVFNVLLSVATGAIVFKIGKMLFSERAGLLALAFWAFYPYSIYYSGWSYPETLTTFLVALDLLFLLHWFRRPTPRWAALCGSLAAATALTNPAGLVFLGLVPLGLLAVQPWRAALRHAPFYYLFMIVCYLPWPIRNQLAFGRPILTNIHGGMNLYQALVVPAEYLGTDEETRIYAGDPYYRKCLEAENPADSYRMLLEGSVRLIRENPGRYFRAVVHRVFKMWRLVPYQRNYTFDYRKIFWVSLLSDGLIIPLGLIGLFFFRGRWKELFPLYAVIGLWTLAYSLIYVVLRYRLPVMIVPILFAAGWLQQLMSRRRPPVAPDASS